jgi:hypothetical protein
MYTRILQGWKVTPCDDGIQVALIRCRQVVLRLSVTQLSSNDFLIVLPDGDEPMSTGFITRGNTPLLK